MKYIFLDIDGVLNTYTGRMTLSDIYNDSDQNNLYRFVEYDGIKHEFLEMKLLKKLHEIIYKTGAVIVGVSSWFGFLDSEYKEETLEKIPKALSLPIYDISDSCSGGESRGYGVLSWLERNGYNPDKDSFVILDDSARFYTFEIRAINSQLGLTDEDVKHAIKVLNSQGVDITGN